MADRRNRTAHVSYALVASLSVLGHDPLVTDRERREAQALAELVRAEQARRDAERLTP